MFGDKNNRVELTFVKRERVYNYWQVYNAVVNGNNYTVKFVSFDEPSIYGIDAGRVSKLSISDDTGKMLVNYDRGWDMKPMTTEERDIVNRVLTLYN